MVLFSCVVDVDGVGGMGGDGGIHSRARERENEEGKERKKRGKGEKRVISLKLNDFYLYLSLSNMYHNIDQKESTDLVSFRAECFYIKINKV
jgi:hypothetical protein